ncbi:MAG: arylamine N-acetyltransferase [Eubacteriales bacterium]
MDWTGFYEPIPDVDAYLKRINIKKQEPSREYLDALVFAHQCSIPFETLDVTDYRRPVSLLTKDMFNKIIIRKRGGYCFELNGLFVLLLQSLGFNAYSCPCRMLMTDDPVPMPATHRASIIKLDNELLFCDVGFGGPMPAGSLIFKEGIEQTVKGETFWFNKESDYWYTLNRRTSGKTKVDTAELYRPEVKNKVTTLSLLSVTPLNYLPVDFYGPNLVRCTGESAFPMRTVALRRPDGYISLIGNTFTEVKGSLRTRISVTEEEAKEILRTRFHLTPEQ